MKAFYKSKTFWYNFLTVILVFARYFGFSPNAELTGQVGDLLAVLSPFVNLYLRGVTDEAIGFKDETK